VLKSIEQRVLKFIDENRLIGKGDRILTAFSGGADSVFLLYFLLKYKRRFKISFAAFHLNHKLRGEDADKDEKFCSSFCTENKIEYYSEAVDVKTIARKNKISVEEAGREIRYKELDQLSKEKGFNKIATAHNASDNAETMLLNVVKGTGIKGLSGIPVKRGKIIRPILTLDSGEIRKYLDEKKITYRIDVSNLDTGYERNFLRKEIIPKLKHKLNPQLEQKLLNSARILRNINSYFESQIKLIENEAVKFSNGKLQINIKILNRLDVRLHGDFFKNIIEKNFHAETSSDNIDDILSLLIMQTGRKIDLTGNLIAAKEREYVLIFRNKKERKFSKQKIRIDGRAEFDGHVLSIDRVKSKKINPLGRKDDKSFEYISGDLIKDDFELRTWKNGDRFYPIGMKGSKKLSDFLTEQKITSIEKRNQLVLTNSGSIVWVVGLRLDERFKLTDSTRKTLRISYQ
jgi:tRNA(Ile)-lysidine synthase